MWLSPAERAAKARAKIVVEAVTGPLTRAVIERTLRRRLASVRRCYTLKPGEDERAVLKITAQVGADGRIRDLEITAGQDHPATPCVRKMLRRIRLPSADAPTEIDVKLALWAR